MLNLDVSQFEQKISMLILYSMIYMLKTSKQKVDSARLKDCQVLDGCYANCG